MESRLDSIKKTPWAAGRPDGYYFVSNPLVINAAPDAVWRQVKDVERYFEFSHGAVKASLPQGELKVGNIIHLIFSPGTFVGKLVPESDEMISLVDDANHIVAWECPVPGGTTECYRVLEPLEDGKQTRLHITLKIPGAAGFFASALLKRKMEEAFNQLAEGIKQEAEKLNVSLSS